MGDGSSSAKGGPFEDNVPCEICFSQIASYVCTREGVHRISLLMMTRRGTIVFDVQMGTVDVGWAWRGGERE